MSVPAVTGLGVAEFVIVRSAELVAAPTIVRTVAELFARFGSLVPDAMETVSAIWVPVGGPGFTFTATVNDAAPAAPSGTSGFVQLITPVPFTAGVVQVTQMHRFRKLRSIGT